MGKHEDRPKETFHKDADKVGKHAAPPSGVRRATENEKAYNGRHRAN